MRLRIILIGSAVLLAGCGGGRSAEPGTTSVVAGFYPLAWAAENVGGPGVHVLNLTPTGAEPHDLELTPRNVAAVESADVVLYFGKGFQPALEDAARKTKGKAVDLLAGLQLARPTHGEEGLQADPHVWLDPMRFAEVVDRVGEVLGRPQTARRVHARLAQLDRDYRRGLTGCKRHEIVTSHAAFGYLAQRYGLEQVPLTGLSPEAEPRPRELADAIDQVRRSGATTIFFETLVSPRLAKTVARETGARTAVLNPIEGLTPEQAHTDADYLSLMRANLAALRKALACR